jgi:hypothetical protein
MAMADSGASSVAATGGVRWRGRRCACAIARAEVAGGGRRWAAGREEKEEEEEEEDDGPTCR